MKHSLILLVISIATLSSASAQNRSLYTALNGSVQTLSVDGGTAQYAANQLTAAASQTTESVLIYGAPLFIETDRLLLTNPAIAVLADLTDQSNNSTLSNYARDAVRKKIPLFCAAMQRLYLNGYKTGYFGDNPLPGEFMRFPDYNGPVEIKTEVRFNPPYIYPGTNDRSDPNNRFANTWQAAHTFTFYKK